MASSIRSGVVSYVSPKSNRIFRAGSAVNGKHYKAANHPITFHNSEVEKFLEVELLHTGLEDAVEFTVQLDNVRSDHKERQPALGHHTTQIVHVVADADEKRHLQDIHAY